MQQSDEGIDRYLRLMELPRRSNPLSLIGRRQLVAVVDIGLMVSFRGLPRGKSIGRMVLTHT